VTKIIKSDLDCSEIEIKSDKKKWKVKLNLPGAYNIYNAAASLALADVIDLNIEKAIKSLNNFEQVRKYIKQVLKFKNESKEQSIRNKNLINQLKNKNIYKSTDCEFHIFQPRHIMGDTIYCSCKFCSVEKHFSQSEWDEYCIKYRKWF
jgi:hypothetical protein